MPSESLNAKQVAVWYFGGLFVLSVGLVVVNALTDAGLSLLWQFSPLWIGWLLVMAAGQAIMIQKFFRYKYWK